MGKIEEEQEREELMSMTRRDYVRKKFELMANNTRRMRNHLVDVSEFLGVEKGSDRQMKVYVFLMLLDEVNEALFHLEEDLIGQHAKKHAP